MPSHLGRIVGAALVAVAVSGTNSGQARSSERDAVRQPRVVVTVDSLHAFGQDGARIAWADVGGVEYGAKRCDGVLKSRDLRTGRTSSLFRADASACAALSQLGGFQHDLAVAGDLVLMSHVTVSNSSYHFDIRLARPGARLRDLGSQHIPGGIGREGPFVPVPMAGDGRTLVYANISSREEIYGYGYVHRADGGRIGGTWGTRAVAASGALFAAGRVELGGCVCHSIMAISPDGARLLIRSFAGPGGVSAGVGTAAIVRTSDGRVERTLSPALTNAVWSPDGSRLLSETREGVVLIEVATGAAKLLRGASRPSWSPDGSQLAYAREARPGTRVLVAAVAGGAPRDLGPGEVSSWSPDGTRLFVLTSADLHEVDLTSGRRRLVVRQPGDLSVSPDGRWVAFSRSGNAGLFLAGVASGAERRLGSSSFDFAWSPDSRRVAFAQSTPERRHLSVAAVDSASVVEVAPVAATPIWSPDGSRIAFTAEQSGKTVVQVATPGESPKTVARGDFPRWSRDSRRLLVSDSEGVAITRVASIEAGSEATLRGVSAERWVPGSDRVLLRLSPGGGDTGEVAVANGDLTGVVQLTRTVRAPSWRGVEVRHATSGKLRWRFATVGEPAAVALDRDRVAVLLVNGKKRRLEVREKDAGSPRRSIAVGGEVTRVSLSGRWLVYLGRGAVRALDIRTGRETLLARPQGTVVGLSVEGTRVAWGEQRRGRADVILALELPA